MGALQTRPAPASAPLSWGAFGKGTLCSVPQFPHVRLADGGTSSVGWLVMRPERPEIPQHPVASPGTSEPEDEDTLLRIQSGARPRT